MRLAVRYFVLLSVLSILGTDNLSAQMFANEDDNATVKVETQSNAKANDWSRFYKQKTKIDDKSSANQNKVNDEKVSVSEEKQNVKKAPEKQTVVNPDDYIYRNVPQVDRPTLDGVKRGRTSVVPVVKNSKVQSEGYIYIFYSDFNVGSMMNGATTCDVKFQILTTLDRKLTSLAVRLKWKEMETPLNFIDVNPNQEYHMVYTLLGDGCYSMDNVPNIIINRCRVKGMTQEDCARRVRWIRKR